MKTTIPTAQNFLRGDDENEPWTGDIEDAMIEFAKLHVKATIKECIESAPSGSSTDTVSYEDVVECLIDCYPVSNIK